MEAEPGIEPRYSDLQSGALPLCYSAIYDDQSHEEENWSGKRGSNSRPQPWQGCALPLSYSR